MADPLSSARNPNVSRATVIELYSEYEAAERAISEAASVKSAAISARKRLRKRIETAGITLSVFDEVRADLEKPDDQREREAREKAQLLTFMGKPPGFQASMDMADHPDPVIRALNTAELKAIDNAGHDAGTLGHNRSDNPHDAGTEAYQRWDTAYIRGQTELAGGIQQGPPAPPAGRRRGRPRVTGNGNGVTAPAANEGPQPEAA